MNPVLTIVKRNFSSSFIGFIVTILVVLLSSTSSAAKIAISRGNYTYLYILIVPFFIVYFNFSKLIYLNATKKYYFWGSMITYIITALAVSLINTFIHLVIDPINQTQTVINLLELCGWWQNGPFLAFFQQFTFLLLVSIFLHLLLSMQTYWYGWITDIALIAIICIFVPIQHLSGILVEFFKLIMFNSNPLLHIGICSIGSFLLAYLCLIVLKKKAI